MFRYSNMPNDNIKIHTMKQLLIYGYLFMNRTMRDEVKLSLEELIIGCGYSPHKGKNNINDQFRQELYTMYEDNRSGHFHLSTQVDILTIGIIERFTIDLSDIILDYDKFTKVEFNDYDKIVLSKYQHKDKMLLVYLYIKSHIFERRKDSNGNETESIEDVQEGYALSYEQIAKDTGISKSTVIKIIKLLEDLEMLHCYTTGGYKDDGGKIRNAPNVYVLYNKQNEIPYIIERLKKLYKTDGFYEINPDSS